MREQRASFSRQVTGAIDYAIATDIQTREQKKKEDYFEDIDLNTKGMSQGERIEAIVQWAHSQEVKSTLFEVTALRFHQQQRGLITKEEYRILRGRMVSFWYQPPSTNKLQVYDRYPLVMIIRRRSNGFTGINFHYLGIRERAELLTYMRDRLAWEHDPKKTRLQITYKMLLSKKRYKYFRPALKSYYKTNIKSRFIMIPEKNWDKALLLPIESFEGNVPTERIWRDSKRMAIRESNRH
jgi:hypothetical protein